MKLLSRLATITAFLIVLVTVIAYARGYRLDLDNKLLKSTGILSINSYPRAAKIFLNGELKGVTDQNISLPPGQYTIEIKKDGYTSWLKTLTLKGELVESVNALLFPINPSLTPLTNLGITKVFLVGQSERLLLFSQNDIPEKDGVYLFDPNKNNLSFLPPLKLIVLKSVLPAQADFTQVSADFSPDLKQTIITFQTPNGDYSYLFSLEDENKQLFEVTTSKEKLLAAWEEEKNLEITKILEGFPNKLEKIASDSFKIISFSPDKMKILYQAKINTVFDLIITPPMIAANQTPEERNLTKDDLYVYDIKEDKNFLIGSWKLEIGNYVMWYSDSDHLVINQEKQISIVDYDNQNMRVIYSGPYEKDFLGITTDGKLLVLTNLNSQINLLPDIYAVGIK